MAVPVLSGCGFQVASWTEVSHLDRKLWFHVKRMCASLQPGKAVMAKKLFRIIWIWSGNYSHNIFIINWWMQLSIYWGFNWTNNNIKKACVIIVIPQFQWPLLLIWVNFIPSMDIKIKWSHVHLIFIIYFPILFISLWTWFLRTMAPTLIGFPMIQMRQCHDCVIFVLGIPTSDCLEIGPCGPFY